MIGDDRMHRLRHPDDRVHGTGAGAQIAADAGGFLDFGNLTRVRSTPSVGEWLHLNSE